MAIKYTLRDLPSWLTLSAQARSHATSANFRLSLQSLVNLGRLTFRQAAAERQKGLERGTRSGQAG